jgi:hypothetical protein
MSQAGNLTSWTGTTLPAKPDFSFPVSPARSDLIESAVIQSFPHAKIAGINGLRAYGNPHDESTIEFRKVPTEGQFKVTLEEPLNGQYPLIMASVKANSDPSIMSFGAKYFNYLQTQGVNTATILRNYAGNYQVDAQGQKVVLTDFQDGIHGDSTPDALEAFGEQIGRMTLALSKYPSIHDLERIKADSQTRFNVWRDGVQQFQDEALKNYIADKPDLAEYFAFAASVLGDYPLDMDDPMMQANHINVIEANTIYNVASDGRVTARIIDGETFHRGWGHRYHDLATFAWRAGLNMPHRETGEKPELSAETLEPLRLAFNDANPKMAISPEHFGKIVVQTASLKLLQVVPAMVKIVNGQKPDMVNSDAELRGHSEKMREMFAPVYKLARSYSIKPMI